MAGIFKNGLWSCGFDFLPNGTITPGGVFDFCTASGVNVNASFARFGTGKGVQCADIPSAITKNLGTNLTTTIVGFGYQPTLLPTTLPNAFASFYDLGAVATQMSLTVNPAGQLQFYQNGGLSPTGGVSVSTAIGSASTAGTIVANAYNFIEILYTNSGSGALQARVNGTQVINFSGNTSKGQNVNAFILGSKQNGVSNNFDDLYILDTTGAAPNNTFLGNGRLQTDIASAAGSFTQWTPTTPTGVNYTNVGNIPALTTRYNSSGTVGQRDSYTFPSLLAAKVYFLNMWISAEEDAAGVREITPKFRSSGSDQSGTAISLSQSYVYYNQTSVTNPNTSASWFSGTVSAASACELGVEVTL